MHSLSITPCLKKKHCFTMEMGIFCPAKDSPTSKLFVRRCRLEAQRDSEGTKRRERKRRIKEIHGLNPVYMKWNIYGSIYI